MVDLEQVKSFIRTANREELKSIANLHNIAMKLIVQEELNEFKKGDIVTIDHENYSKDVVYVIQRVSSKTITIANVGLGRSYRVSPKFLVKSTVGSFPKLK
jgi:NMD protein affecting ribosome stability and mRNA decay